MSDLKTVRQRVHRASDYFHAIEGVVLTTFNLNTTFLEEHALPAILGVEATSNAAKSTELHCRLGATPCTVYYDPTSQPKVSGRYRYVTRPAPVRGHFFHPKLVVLAGQSEDRTTWVYLAVSSANITSSGWGRNAESFGETWIHTRGQDTWNALDAFLSWLGSHSQLGETRTKGDAVTQVRAILARMPERKRFSDDETQPWSGSLYADLYTSVVDRHGLAAFLRRRHRRRPSELRAYAPYWSDVTDQLGAFNAHRSILVPALRPDGASLSLTRDQADALDQRTVIHRNYDDIGDRFWHMKTYQVRYGRTIRTAVGSCNFTHAGLSGANANVEAMLVFDADPDWLPEGRSVHAEELADAVQPEEETPEPVRVAIVVAWDWLSHVWRWNLEADSGQYDFVLHLPGLTPFRIVPGNDTKPGKEPSRGATFKVTYSTTHGELEWRAPVVELNLYHSSRSYGRLLAANEILESWRGQAPSWDVGGAGASHLGENDDDSDDVEHDAPAAFDAMNLYDLYRSISALRTKLSRLHKAPDMQRAYLVGRPDSVMALARLAERDEQAPIVRYLVLRETFGLVSNWGAILDENLVAQAREMVARARDHTRATLLDELREEQDAADDMLDWFEQQFSRLDQEANS